MSDYVKYPRTYHLPYSQSNSSDDVWWKDTKLFDGQEVVITEKLDGENTTVYPDGHVHARSLDSRHHPSRSWMKSFASSFAYKIPKNLRICGENLYAYHSIFYTELPTYFFVYGIYNDDLCLPWDKVEDICSELELQTVPVISKGIWDSKIKDQWNGIGRFPTFALKNGSKTTNYPDDFQSCPSEGYVVRLIEGFMYQQFRNKCAKFVADHFKDSMRDVHWASVSVLPNLLKTD